VLHFSVDALSERALCGGGYEVSQVLKQEHIEGAGVVVKRADVEVGFFSTTAFASVFAVACGAITGPEQTDLVLLVRDHANSGKSASLMLYRLGTGVQFVNRLETLDDAGIKQKPGGGYWFVTRAPELDHSPFRAGNLDLPNRLGPFPRVYELKNERFVEVSASVPQFYRQERQRDIGATPVPDEDGENVFLAFVDGAYSAFVGDWAERRARYGKKASAAGDATAAGFKKWLLQQRPR
jgi:hypothetical protein